MKWSVIVITTQNFHSSITNLITGRTTYVGSVGNIKNAKVTLSVWCVCLLHFHVYNTKPILMKFGTEIEMTFRKKRKVEKWLKEEMNMCM